MEEKKDARCLILRKLNEDKCFCREEMIPILEILQSNFVSMFVASFDTCAGLEILEG